MLSPPQKGHFTAETQSNFSEFATNFTNWHEFYFFLFV